MELKAVEGMKRKEVPVYGCLIGIRPWVLSARTSWVISPSPLIDNGAYPISPPLAIFLAR